jgi:hypothetical protein
MSTCVWLTFLQGELRPCLFPATTENVVIRVHLYCSVRVEGRIGVHVSAVQRLSTAWFTRMFLNVSVILFLKICFFRVLVPATMCVANKTVSLLLTGVFQLLGWHFICGDICRESDWIARGAGWASCKERGGLLQDEWRSNLRSPASPLPPCLL